MQVLFEAVDFGCVLLILFTVALLTSTDLVDSMVDVIRVDIGRRITDGFVRLAVKRLVKRSTLRLNKVGVW